MTKVDRTKWANWSAQEGQMKGGCLCGAVRYIAEGEPLSSGICHCETCRRAASAPRLPFVSVPSAGFRYTTGALIDYISSPGVTRSFCGRCGSPLTYRRDDTPGELDVMTVSLDNPNTIHPTLHVWTGEALDWDQITGISCAMRNHAPDKRPV